MSFNNKLHFVQVENESFDQLDISQIRFLSNVRDAAFKIWISLKKEQQAQFLNRVDLMGPNKVNNQVTYLSFAQNNGKLLLGQ